MTGIFGYISKEINREQIYNVLHESEYYIKELKDTPSCILCSFDIKTSKTKKRNKNNEEKISLVTCGEIYNSDTTDLTTRLSALYNENKLELTRNLNGAFAAAIYDDDRQKITIVNDRYGLIKIYYYYDKNHFYFAPTIQTLLQLGVKTTIKKESLFDFFIFRYFLGDKTFFKDIHLLPPASILEVSKDEMKLSRYWNYDSTTNYDNRSEKELTDELGTLWQNAIKKRVKDSETILIPLSGGLDSRAILAAVLKCTSKDKIITYTFGEPGSYDLEIGKMIASKAGVKNISIIPEKNNFEKQYIDSLKDAEGMIDATPYFPINLPQYLTQENSIIFSGHMGGEIMGPKIFPKLDGINPLSQDKHSLIKNILFEHHKLNEIDEIKKMFNPEYLNNQNLLESFEESIKNLNKISDDNLPNFCASWLYNQETLKYTSFCNIRFRNLYKYSLPFLDNDVIDFMLKVPSKFRIEKKLYKSMLIKNYSDLFSLPTKNTYGLKLTTNDLALYIKIFLESFQKRINRISSFLIRKNVFFIKSHNYIDYDDLLRTNKEYQNFMREKINNVLSREYFNKDSIEKIWKLHIDGRKNYAMLIGLLVTFEIFLENYTTN